MSGLTETLCDILQRRAREQGDQLAYIYLNDEDLHEQPITYAELDRQARDIAAQLHQISHRGDRALLLYPQGLEFVAAFFGCLYAGVIAVPAYPPRAHRNLARLQAIAADCQATVALSTASLGDTIRRSAEAGALGELRWLATDTAVASTAPWSASATASDAIAFLQYTSGSTGAPKGVMVSHGNLMHNSRCIRDRWLHSPSSVGVSWLPQFHDLGLIIGILQPVYVGYRAILMSPGSFIQRPACWLEAISKYRGTTTCAPNFAFDLCVLKISPAQRAALDLSCLETVMNGAEPILLETIRSFGQAFAPHGFHAGAFRGGYGLAEGTVFVTTSVRAPDGPASKTVYREALEQHRVEDAAAPGKDTQYLVGCGSTSEDQELAIVDPDRGTRCRPEQIGEIWVRGPSVALGYWQRPQETEQVFRAFLDDGQRGPFLRTGDLGFVQGDDLYITGRIKDLIIVRGRNHYPQDLERTAEKVHRCLRINCNAAFSVRDGAAERAVVVQELRRDHAGVDLDQLAADIYQAVLTEHELALSSVLLIAEGDISKTSSGKIQRAVCLQRYQRAGFRVLKQMDFEVTAQPGASTKGLLLRALERGPQESRAHAEMYLVQTIRAARPGIFHVDVHVPLLQLGIDSLGVAELKGAIEGDLGITFPYSTLMEATLRQLAEIVIEQLATRAPRGDDDVALHRIDAMSDAEVNALLEEMLAVSGGGNGQA